MVAFLNSWYEGDVAAARAAHDKLFALMDSMFIETNPIPIKCLMAEQELLKPHFRLPLVPASDATMAKVRTLFAAVNK